MLRYQLRRAFAIMPRTVTVVSSRRVWQVIQVTVSGHSMSIDNDLKYVTTVGTILHRTKGVLLKKVFSITKVKIGSKSDF